MAKARTTATTFLILPRIVTMAAHKTTSCPTDEAQTFLCLRRVRWCVLCRFEDDITALSTVSGCYAVWKTSTWYQNWVELSRGEPVPRSGKAPLNLPQDGGIVTILPPSFLQPLMTDSEGLGDKAAKASKKWTRFYTTKCMLALGANFNPEISSMNRTPVRIWIYHVAM